jgi:hypothetical protein
MCDVRTPPSDNETEMKVSVFVSVRRQISNAWAARRAKETGRAEVIDLARQMKAADAVEVQLAHEGSVVAYARSHFRRQQVIRRSSRSRPTQEGGGRTSLWYDLVADALVHTKVQTISSSGCRARAARRLLDSELAGHDSSLPKKIVHKRGRRYT